MPISKLVIFDSYAKKTNRFSDIGVVVISFYLWDQEIRYRFEV